MSSAKETITVRSQDKQHPKVFVSHSGLDKARFVLRFAEKLRAVGIDAWLDKWEMLPGDSLVDKVIGKGLKDADAIIIVISQNSIESKWAREEMNAGFIKRIESNCRLIPVIIDECDVPSALKSTLWERIPDINDYAPAFDRIVAAVFGKTEKPPLGPIPGYSRSALPAVSGLEIIDKLVLKCAGDKVVKSTDKSEVVNVKEVCQSLEQADVTEDQVLESIEVLEEQGYLQSRGHWWFQLSHFGLSQYLGTFLERFDDCYQSICSQIVNSGRETDTEIADVERISRPIVQHVIHDLENRGQVIASKTNSGYRIVDITAGFKRAMRG